MQKISLKIKDRVARSARKGRCDIHGA